MAGLGDGHGMEHGMGDHGMEHGMGDHGMMNEHMGHGGNTKMTMHMTFFWGNHAQVLFSGWPGTRTGMYVLALIVIFLMAVLVEWLSRCSRRSEEGSISTTSTTTGRVGAGLTSTFLHTVRTGVSYLIMLALMSFNGGIFIAAIAGHLVGFLVFGSRIFERTEMPPYVKHQTTHNPNMSAC